MMKSGALFVTVFAILAFQADCEAQLRRGTNLLPHDGRTLQTLRNRGNNPSFQLGQCEGDCDNDNDCTGQLICFQKNSGGSGQVPGCAGTDTTRVDFCIDPADIGAPTGSPPAPAPTGGGNALFNYGPSPPTSALPLGVCEGDCDADSDCASGLQCLQRGANAGPVPGCNGRDNGKTDYCVASGASPPGPSPPGPSPTAPAPTSSSVSQNFKLKIYWEEGYFWQEESFERKWCMRCRDGNCDAGDKLYIENCSEDVERFDFDYVNNEEALIKVHGTDRCLERAGRDIYIRSCNSGNSLQRWWAKTGGFDQGRFEISQLGATNLCVTQRHHPKSDEEVELEPCEQPRSSDTSFWERCYDDTC